MFQSFPERRTPDKSKKYLIYISHMDHTVRNKGQDEEERDEYEHGLDVRLVVGKDYMTNDFEHRRQVLKDVRRPNLCHCSGNCNNPISPQVNSKEKFHSCVSLSNLDQTFQDENSFDVEVQEIQ